ncbi:MAG: hypothetical protein SGJ11_17100 [Phycisphaerae bacterium]|nr:hypothetical protein [Phycisphaerae bacterium]
MRVTAVQQAGAGRRWISGRTGAAATCYNRTQMCAAEPNEIYELPAEGAFPATQRDWLVAQVTAGDEGRLQANAFVMQIYAPALDAYLRGSSFRSLGASQDLVAGFFASRLDRPDFFTRWLASGFAFRRWIANAFLFFLHEESRRKRQRAGLVLDDKSDPPALEPDAVERYEAQWAREVVQRACEQAQDICSRCGWTLHWDVFVRHHAAGASYVDIARELSLDPRQGPALARTGGGVLRRAIEEILVRDGVAKSELASEAARLMSALRKR